MDRGDTPWGACGTPIPGIPTLHLTFPPLSPAPAAAGGRGGAFVPTSPPSSNGIPAPKELDSPESPFEVVPDRAAFDREYGPGSIPMAEREVLSQIPEDRVCDFPVKARTGNGIPGLPAKLPTGLSRQASGTAAALEEVSKCVREMHSFTSELLSWDLVERNGGNGNSAGNPGPNEADSSGDSDDTVIEEAPMENAPIPIPPGANPIPNPIPAARDWEEERLTLRALQELGEPPREPPDPSGNVAEPPPPAGRPLLLQPSLAGKAQPPAPNPPFLDPKQRRVIPKPARGGGKGGSSPIVLPLKRVGGACVCLMFWVEKGGFWGPTRR